MFPFPWCHLGASSLYSAPHMIWLAPYTCFQHFLLWLRPRLSTSGMQMHAGFCTCQIFALKCANNTFCNEPPPMETCLKSQYWIYISFIVVHSIIKKVAEFIYFQIQTICAGVSMRTAADTAELHRPVSGLCHTLFDVFQTWEPFSWGTKQTVQY